jgi:Mrp family chromosome partitioning ATPase
VTGAHAVLYLDCGHVDRGAAPGGLPPSLVEAFLTEMPPAAGILPARSAPGLCWAWLGAVDDDGPRCSTAAMGHLSDELRVRFAVVVLDCPAAATAPETLSLSRHCDGTLLVVQAERTRSQAVALARDGIERFGGQVIGTVFNRSRRLPRWLTAR